LVESGERINHPAGINWPNTPSGETVGRLGPAADQTPSVGVVAAGGTSGPGRLSWRGPSRRGREARNFGPKDDGTYVVELPYGLFVPQWWASRVGSLSGFNRFVTARRVSLRASDPSESDMQRIPQCGEPRPVSVLAGASLFAFSRSWPLARSARHVGMPRLSAPAG
jgi:hypothetical protein